MSKLLRLSAYGTGIVGAYLVYGTLSDRGPAGGASNRNTVSQQPRFHGPLPTRAEHVARMCTVDYDVLVIGGGATGAGCALDAASRGLSTALVELDDFSAGTSSRSTKLLHGGVRYLQKAVMQLDVQQYNMVREALQERGNLLQIAPHLATPLPIMLPVYRWWQLPYYYAGIKLYDIVAGASCLQASHVLSRRKVLQAFPMLRSQSLVGGIVYYDGQHDDARMNVSLVVTAVRMGANVLNHCRVESLTHDAAGRVCGAVCRDTLSGQTLCVRAKCVINACGPFTDSVRAMDAPDAREICSPSAGVHIVLPGYYSPDHMGLLDPSTSDGRVIFFLPWLDHTIAGTTDTPCALTHSPAPSEQDIAFILGEVKNYLSEDIAVRRGDVLSAWCGIRPLVRDPNKPDTQSLARNHIVHVSPRGGLVTVAGGKWTTYRSMAEETLDVAVGADDRLAAKASGCRTLGLLLEGAHGWSPTMHIRLVQDLGLDPAVAKHLADSYGDRAFAVAKLCQTTGKSWPMIGRRLDEDFPYIEAEVRYAIREYACTVVDVVARRLRLAFLNTRACSNVLERVACIMAEELGWDEAHRRAQIQEAMEFLDQQMGAAVSCNSRPQLSNLGEREVAELRREFGRIASAGRLSVVDVRRHLGASVAGDDMHAALTLVDPHNNGCLDVDMYLQLVSILKLDSAEISRMLGERASGGGGGGGASGGCTQKVDRIDVTRSGGGV